MNIVRYLSHPHKANMNDVLAYMWWNLAAANGDDSASKNKDIIAERMTSSQIEKAQELSRECFKNDYKNCY